MRKRRTVFKVVAAYDTETTNITETHEAFVSLYIVNDLRKIQPLSSYQVDDPREHIMFGRTVNDMLDILNTFIMDGIEHHYVPVIAAYNLAFDIQTLLRVLCAGFKLTTTAQSAQNYYYVDVNDMETGECRLRFWDTFFLEQGGLSAMGETAGVPKAIGDWDYSLVRTPFTPLSERELHYASRDVQVIPAYFAYLLKANEWLTPDMLGSKVLTRTGLVRQMAANQLRNLRLPHHKNVIGVEFAKKCQVEFPKDYDTYALRKACFRGGFTFTAARHASVAKHDVASLDVTSMHHAFINGRRVPYGFVKMPTRMLQMFADHVVSVSPDEVLKFYDKPFNCAFHCRIRFTNLRLKAGSPFEYHGIGLIPRGKFAKSAKVTEFYDRPREIAAENGTRSHGWHDHATGVVFAFGKLMSAAEATVHVCETELWCIAQVYDWDSMEVVAGEGATRFDVPPAYVTLQSNLLFNRKSDVKRITKEYKPGTPFTGDIPPSIPEGIAAGLRDGSITGEFLTHYYNSTVKGQFNGIYGTQAQDLLKPDYMVTDEGVVEVDDDTIATPENYSQRMPSRCRVWYTYGMRIVGGSRMHLVLAIILLWRRFGPQCEILGGDTDSLKIACNGLSDTDLASTVDPLLKAVQKAISACEWPIREAFPNLASPLTHVGGFEVENAGHHYPNHMELWNKARVSQDEHGAYHVTLAGVSRPDGSYHLEHWMRDMEDAGHSFQWVVERCAWNANLTPELSHGLEQTYPHPMDVYDDDVVDHNGEIQHVTAPMAVCLYAAGRMLGDTSKNVNRECVDYLRKTYDRRVYQTPHVNNVTDTEALMETWDETITARKGNR